MSSVVRWLLACNARSCAEEFVGEPNATLGSTREAAARDGWRNPEVSIDFCPGHPVGYARTPGSAGSASGTADE